MLKKHNSEVANLKQQQDLQKQLIEQRKARELEERAARARAEEARLAREKAERVAALRCKKEKLLASRIADGSSFVSKVVQDELAREQASKEDREKALVAHHQALVDKAKQVEAEAHAAKLVQEQEAALAKKDAEARVAAELANKEELTGVAARIAQLQGR